MKIVTKLLLLGALQSANVCAGDIFESNKLFKAGNYQQAYQGYKESAELGNPHAYYQLARMYFKGLGVEQDITNAVLNYALAAEYNYYNADKVLSEVLSTIPEKKRAEAEKVLETAKLQYGKAAVVDKLFPIVNEKALGTKVIRPSRDESHYYENFYDDFLYHGFSGFGAFNDLYMSYTSPKLPFVILDVDFAADGTVRHYDIVQKFGAPYYTNKLLDNYLLYPKGEHKLKGQSVDFVQRVRIGQATDFDKFSFIDDYPRIYGEISMKAKKFRESKSLQDQYQYSMILLNFPFMKQAEGEAEQRLFEIAKLGHPAAMYEYGMLLYRDQRNIPEAIYWISQASKYGLTRAEFRLAKILQSSPWVENDEKKALFWYETLKAKDHLAATLKAIEIKLTAKDKSLIDIASAKEDLASLADKHKNNNPEYFYLLALSHNTGENRNFSGVVDNLKLAINHGQRKNWDVSEWQALLSRVTSGGVTISDHS